MFNDNLPSPAPTGHSYGSPDHTPSPTTQAPPRLPLSRRSSTSRPIVPTPLSINLTPRVSIATASSPVSDHNPSPVGGGPTGRSYVVPPRPKPGRKPATDEPASKRKAQNRESQRAFRARKAAKLTEMQTQVESVESKHKNEMARKIAELHDHTLRIKDLEAQLAQVNEAQKRTAQERDYWKEHAAHDLAQYQMLDRQWRQQNYPMNPQAVFFPTPMPGSRQDSPARASITSLSGYHTPKALDFGCGNCKPDGECACVAELAKVSPVNPFMAAVPLATRTSVSPVKSMQNRTPVDVFADREFDFTSRFPRRAQPAQPASIRFMTETSEVDSSCGFCTDESNCLCKDQTLQHQDVQRQSNEVFPITSAVIKTGPGSCLDCQTNPQQKAWCQRVAQLRSSGDGLPRSPISRTSSIGSTLETMEPRIVDASTPYGAKSSIGCSEAYNLFEGRLTDRDKMDWIGNLKPVPPNPRRDTITQHTRNYSALELDTAGVIATLGNTIQPLQARPSDGENANIVQIARQYQRSTASPMEQSCSGSSLHVASLLNGATTSAGTWSMPLAGP